MATVAGKSSWGRLTPLKHKVQSLLRSIGLELVHDFDADAFRLRRFRDIGGDQWLAAKAILGREARLIFDVGANTGQTAIELARRFPSAEIHSFEPAPAVARELRRRTAHLPNVVAHELALGDFDGRAPFHVNRMGQTSSLLPARHTSRQMETVEIIDVDVRRASTLCAEIGRPDILKTDAQGMDLKVIEAAPAIPLVYAEVCFVPFYEGQPTFGQFHDRMQALGYRLVDLYETGFRTHFYQLSCNALFMREDGPHP